MANSDISNIFDADSEKSLIDRVCLHDEGALAQIYDHFASIVYSIALRVLNEASAAEDVTQEVFLELWRDPDAFIPQCGPLWVRLALAGRSRAIHSLRQGKSDNRVENTGLASCGKPRFCRAAMRKA